VVWLNSESLEALRMPAWIGGILQVCVVSGASKSRISRELRACVGIPKVEFRSPTRCDGAAARREEGRIPKSEVRGRIMKKR